MPACISLCAIISALVAILLAIMSQRRCGGSEYTTTQDGRISFTQLSHPEYPCIIAGFNTLITSFNMIDWLLPLNEEYLIAKASANTGLAIFGREGDPSRSHLRQLLNAIKAEADLSPIGRFMSQQQLIKSLEQRARVTQLIDERPDILRVPLLRPLIITGMPRTGTTLLHNLLTLSGHPGVQHLTYAATLQPVAAASGPEHKLARTEVQQAVIFMGFMRPLFSAMHEMEAELPHEELHLQVRSAAANPWT